MRIMHFAGGGDIGGAKTHILSLGTELAKNNAFHLVSFRPGPFAEEARALGISVTVAEHAWNLVSSLKTALAAVDSFKPDVIHCHGAKANMMGVLVRKLRGVPLVTTVHSDPTRDYMGAPLKQMTFGSINLWALKRMDYYMAVAGGMEKSLIRRGIDPQRIFVVYNGLDFSQADDAPRPTPEAQADIVVGIAARLTPIKNIPTLLKAFAKAQAKNPRLRLKIAGIGEDEAELKALTKKLGIVDRVDFVGWITDMPRFFSGVDINVLSSFSETFPYSLLEGAYAHCAAIASRVGGIPELIEHENTGLLFDPEDVDTFSDYIYRLSVDDEWRHTLAENLYQRAKQSFSLENLRNTQERAYRIVLRRSAAKQERHGAVICGAYGRGNAGDEAILDAIIAQMRQIDPDMPLTVMTRNKQGTRLKNRTDAIYIFNVPGFLRHLKRAKIFINGGGSLIQDVTSSRSLYFYLFTLWAARLCGCRVLMYGCGIGPIHRKRNKRIAARVLNRNVERITVRDSNSQQVLAAMHVDKPGIELSADPTVTMQPANETRLAAAFAKENIPADVPKIAFCLRNWPAFHNQQAVAEAADYASRKYGFLPVFIPIELPRDNEAAQQVTALMQEPFHACSQRYAVEELIAMLGSMKMVVGMRLHSLIFSTIAQTPVVAISYDIKVDSFMRDIGSAHCIPLADLSAEKLKEEIDNVAQAGCPRAVEAYERLCHGEDINVSAAKELLGVTI